jgi:hypothetical protein
MFSPKAKGVTLSSLTGGMTAAQIQDAVNGGARFVVFSYTFSALIVTFRRSSPIQFIRAGESAVKRSLPWTMTSLLLGWWGFPFGLVFTPMSLWTNLNGGKDVTQAILTRIYGTRQDMVELFPESGAKAEPFVS